MSSAVMTKRIAEMSPRFKARITAAFYLLTILLGGLVLSVHGKLALPVDLGATACYVAVTALFYELSKSLTGRTARADRHSRK
ncbi:MAG: hypothetical protein WAL56_19050 [Candidatus Sulfotelmatobacter sp.]